MLGRWQESLSALVRDAVQSLYDLEDEGAALTPPNRSLGDLAFPAAMGLARQLKRNPREIATEILARMELPEFVREIRIEGAGYLNVFLRRETLASHLLSDGPGPAVPEGAAAGKVIIEHTNINPNKAAHIGHLRNAVLGDVLASVLRRLGHQVEVQNYIDDTGVQLADVIVGFLDLRGMSTDEVIQLGEPFDHYCWDLYAEVGRWYEQDAERLETRRTTLRQLESNVGERAEIGRIIAQRVVGCHLATMRRLGVGYDLLTHERAILELDFFSRAFEKLKAAGTVRLEATGKNAGCWVMPLSESEEFKGLEDPDKVIVRSDGTVTYVGKDIAYQLWKFGLLGEDFGYHFWEEEQIWQTVSEGDAEHPDFGAATRVINVIDARQSYLQKIVRTGLEALGHRQQAAASIHFAYEMVSLAPGTARQLGFLQESEDAHGASLEMSGRKGIGVKADDLLDMLESKSRDEISQRHRDLPEAELADLSRQIATAALRFFMVKATTTRIIAFDLDEALSFEGETGPYLQYSVVRARNIRRKLAAAGMATTVSRAQLAAAGSEPWADDLWDLVLTAASIRETVTRAGETLELSLVARHALDLAQKFNAIYHRHPILQEQDEALRAVRLAVTQIFEVALADLASLLGIPLPDRM